ncbi:MAG: hypothetical protein C0460_14455 [Methylibium sp.]|nr:hypothetical protein [Methylibium sp.]
MAGLSPELEALPVGVLQVGLQGEVLAGNACLGRWLGQPAASLVGERVDQLLSRAGRVLYHTHLMPTLRLHGEVQELSLALRGRAGTVHVLCSAQLLSTPDGPRAQLVLSPMRERLRIEAELARVQRAADAAPLVLFECVREVDGRAWLSYASAGLVALYGLTPEAVAFDEQAWLDRVHAEDRAKLLAAREASAGNRGLWLAQFRARSAAGAWRWHRLRAQPYAEPDGRVVWYGLMTDVTEQIAAEGAERDRNAAELANRSKSEFLARMSHELRTPLNAIIGFSHLLGQDRACSAPQVQQRLGIIHTAGQQLLRLVDDVLDISRIESGGLHLALAPLRLAPLAGEVCQALEPARAARGVALSLTAEPDLAARADEARLRQVLSNLVSNAIKYTRAQGWVQVELAAAGDQVALRVRDNGPGLTPAQQQQLFQPFNRLGAERTSVEGTGLGLVICRHLTDSMGGRLSVESSPGAGCCFTVMLPRAEAAAADAPPPPPMTEATPRAGRNWQLLYAEDDPVNALLMQAVLERMPGVQLHVAPRGEAACQMAQASPPDLLMLDMHLPDMDGCALLARLRALPGLASVPAVAVSADAMPSEIAQALAAGFTAYWTKPLDVERLPGELATMLRPDTAPPDDARPLPARR